MMDTRASLGGLNHLAECLREAAVNRHDDVLEQTIYVLECLIERIEALETDAKAKR